MAIEQETVDTALTNAAGAAKIVSSPTMVSQENPDIEKLLKLKSVVDNKLAASSGVKRSRRIVFGEM